MSECHNFNVEKMLNGLSTSSMSRTSPKYVKTIMKNMILAAIYDAVPVHLTRCKHAANLFTQTIHN